MKALHTPRPLVALAAAALALHCDRSRGTSRDDALPRPAAHSSGRLPALPDRPTRPASAAFTTAWGDGRAELSGYRAVVPRYGELRAAELVLVYVTEPLDRRTWIKDDAAPPAQRVGVIKLNQSLKFQTGIYPYSVLTSVFAPVDAYRPGERFAPVKITLSVQEWCGHVFHGVWPDERGYVSQLFSYFAEEGERREEVAAPAGALYEDALLIQLRELDGPFAGGGDWQGWIVPTLWRTRRTHARSEPVRATIARTRATLDGVAVSRFVLRYGDVTRSFDVETAAPRRVLAWQISDGEQVRLLRTARLSYWQLNHNGDEREREAFGVSAGESAPDGAPPGDAAVGF